MAQVKLDLDFVDPPPAPVLELGTCREAEIVNNFYWRDHVSIYTLEHRDGRRIYVLIQRGKETKPLENLQILWTGGPVTFYHPPRPEPVTVTPEGGKLTLPPWRDVVILHEGEIKP